MFDREKGALHLLLGLSVALSIYQVCLFHISFYLYKLIGGGILGGFLHRSLLQEMSAISNFTACRRFQNGAALTKDSPGVGLITNKFLATKISTPFHKVSLVCSKRTFKGSNIRMTMLDDKLSSGKVVVPSEVLAYELVQGAKVKWSYIMEGSLPEPPTAVLLHGILGSRKNWGSFARRLAQEFPKWQFLLVDLRCHGDSASLKKRGTHTVASAALDVLKLLH